MTVKNFFVGRAIVSIALLVIIGLFIAFSSFGKKEQTSGIADHKNAQYSIEGVPVTLIDGVAETEAAPGSASRTTTQYFGNELISDLNDDGREDVVFLLTQSGEGSGTFYYVVAALNTDQGYVGSDAVLLGDRIAPQTMEKGKGKVIIVNYAERAQGEPFSVSPSVGKSRGFLLDPQTMTFGEVELNFEGEADPSIMTLGMKTWTWISALYNDGREIRPIREKAFTLKFGSDGNFSVTTDCNSMGGTYSVEGQIISFSQMFSTKMYCIDSQEAEFARLLEDMHTYHFTSRGELVLDLKFDSGSVVFR